MKITKVVVNQIIFIVKLPFILESLTIKRKIGIPLNGFSMLQGFNSYQF